MMRRYIVFAVAMMIATVGFAQKDVTAQYITNATLANGTAGWTVKNFNAPQQGNNTTGYATEAYAGWGGFDANTTPYYLKQTITLPAGHYTLVNYSFYREGEQYNTDANTSKAFLYAGSNQIAIKTLGSISAGGYANNQAEGANAFDSKMYRNTLDFTIDADGTEIEIGLTGTFTAMRSWCIAGMFELIDNDQLATMDSPFDVTGYITNPGFEYRNMKGWTLSGNDALGTQSNEQSFKVGGFYAEKWQAATSGALSARSMSQTISDLPAGYYKLSANLGGNGTYLDLNGKRVNWTADGDYNVGYVLGENEDLTITAGKTAEGTANWIHFDNFKLYFCGDVAEALQTLLSQVTSYQDQLPSDVYAQLQNDVAAYDQTYTDVDELLAAISAVEALYTEADQYSANFTAAYDLLEVALTRFEVDYNQLIADGTNYGRRLMSQKAWTDLLAKVNDVTAAMDEGSDYSSFASVAQALNDQLNATDASIRLFRSYLSMLQGCQSLGLTTTAYEADTYTETDASVEEAITALNTVFTDFATTQSEDFSMAGFLGDNLDFSQALGDNLVGSAFENLKNISGWRVKYDGLSDGSATIYMSNKSDEEGHTTNLYIRKNWYASPVTLQALKEVMLPVGSYTLTYWINSDGQNIADNLCYYSLDGAQTSLASSDGSWTPVTKTIEVTDAPMPFDLSFGFVTSGSGNAPAQILVDDITLTYQAVSQFQIALDAARAAQADDASGAAAAAVAQWEEYEGNEGNFATAEDKQSAINILNNAVLIAQNGGKANSLIVNADFTGGTSSMAVQGSGGQVNYPAGWTFSRTYSGWNDSYVANGVFNAWAGAISLAELYQSLSDMPNGQYKLTAEVKTDVTDGSSAIAIYGNPDNEHVGRSPEVTSSDFATYSVEFQVTQNQFSIGIRSDKAYYQVKNFQLSFVPTNNATAQAAMLQQDYFWKRGDSDVDLTASKYDEAEGAVLYPQYKNQVVRVNNAKEIASPTSNIVAGGVCAELVLTDKEPLNITGASFTATNATYERTMGNTFGTLILPFAVNANDDLKFFLLSNATGDTANEEGELEFTAAASIEANTPMLVKKLNSDATGISIHEAEVTVEATPQDLTASTEANGWTAEGYYDNITMTDAPDVFYIANNKFWAAGASLTINAFRAIYRYNGSGTINRMSISIDENANAIQGVSGEAPVAGGVYTISGQLVRRNANAEGLAPGLYIINGKKVLVK